MAAPLRFDDGLTSLSPQPRNIFSLKSPTKKSKQKTYGKPAVTKKFRAGPGASPDPEKKKNEEEDDAGEEKKKPKSNRQRRREEKTALWGAHLAQLKQNDPKPNNAPTPGNADVEFLRKKRQRQREAAGSGGPVANDRKRQRRDEFPLLNGTPAPRLTPVPATTTKAEEKKPEDGRAHIAQIRAIAHRLEAQRKQLPIWPHRESLRQCLRDRDVLVMLGQTGSGKSTQIGQFLLDEDWMRNGKGCIAITQPRRVAAINLAKRVSAEMGVRLGEEVGYSVRFKNQTSDKTRIKFLTDGMLLQEMLADPLLKRYSAVVVDEAHERTVGTDLVMGFLRALVYGERRGKLKVVIMSATLEVEAMAKFFEENRGEGILLPPAEEVVEVQEVTNETKEEIKAEGPAANDKKARKKKKKKNKKGQYNIEDLIRSPSPIPERIKTPEIKEGDHMGAIVNTENGASIIPYFGSVALFQVPGRQFPVEVYHSAEPVQDYLEAALKTVFQIHYQEPLPGDILVFLTGQEDIETLKKTILQYAENMAKDVPKMLVLPLYAALPIPQQNKVFEPARERNTRKIILSTNIAETSVTVTGVRHVVDCGKAKLKQFRPKLGLESLLVTPISKSSALQRTGRAGREAAGKCYRLFTEADFNALKEATKPEILRTDIANAILILKARGQNDVVNFDYLSPPKIDSLQKALEQLHSLGAFDNAGKITPLGKKMARLPLSPPLARVLLAAAEPGLNCLPEVVDIIAALSTDNIFPPIPNEDAREAVDEARKAFRRREGDHIMLLEVVRAYDSAAPHARQWCETHFVSPIAMRNMVDIRQQLRQYCSSFKGASDEWGCSEGEAVSPDLAQRVLKSFLKGYFHQTARAAPDGREYLTVLGHQTVAIHPASILFGERREAIVYHEYVFTTRPFGRWCSAVQLDWVAEAAPADVRGAV